MRARPIWTMWLLMATAPLCRAAAAADTYGANPALGSGPPHATTPGHLPATPDGGYGHGRFGHAFHHGRAGPHPFYRHPAPATPFGSSWFRRPYPYHLDYYRMRYGGSYEPYFGNLYGPPIIYAPPLRHYGFHGGIPYW
jgi:hypothetical protein